MTETHNHGFRVLGVAVEGSFGLCSAIAHLYFKSCGKYGFLKQPDYVEKNRTKLPGLRVKCEDTDLVFLAALHPGDLRHWRETLKGCTETRREQLGLLQKLAALPRWSTNIFTPRMHSEFHDSLMDCLALALSPSHSSVRPPRYHYGYSLGKAHHADPADSGQRRFPAGLITQFVLLFSSSLPVTYQSIS